MSLNQTSEKTFALVADDLTGANDTGIQFLKWGLRTLVLIDLEIGPEPVNRADVLVLNTDSRFLEPEQAYAQTKQMALVLKNLGTSRVYKKIDSTLRGNVGAEIDALMEVFPYRVCFLTPAFPVYDRTVRDGSLYLKGVPIHRTKIALDPAFRGKSSFIPDLLKLQTRRRIEVIPLETLRGGVEALLRTLNRLAGEGVQIFVLDALVQSDLKIAAQAIAKVSFPALICGSAGLAVEIPEAFHLEVKGGSGGKQGHGEVGETGERRDDPRSPTPLPTSVVGICGSRSVVTREQVSYAAKSLQIPVLEAAPDKVLEDRQREEEIRGLAASAASFLSQGRDILVGVAASGSAEKLSQDEFVRNSRKIADALGILAVELLRTGKVSGLFLTGGDIALSVCEAIKAQGIYLLDEVLPGIPLGQLMGGEYPGLKVITKAGAFGHPEAIAQCIRHLKKIAV